MDTTSVLLFVAAGAAAGALVAWLVSRRIAQADLARALSEAESRARASETSLREQLARHEAEAQLTARHGNVAELLAPIRDTLVRYDDALVQLGRAQAHVAGQIGERLEAVVL